jgi:hypothetical protein
MRQQKSHITAILAVVASILAFGVSGALAQGVGTSISQNDRTEAAEALAAGHYGIELTPPQNAVANG